MSASSDDRLHPERSDSVDALLDEGLQYHRNGRLADAERLYQQILKTNSQHVDALHLLGLIRHQTGRHAEAVETIQQAISLQTTPSPVLLTNLGAVLQMSGRLDEAAACFRRAIQVKADDRTAHLHLGRLLAARGQTQAAAEVWCALANLLLQQEQAEEAFVYFRLAQEFLPDNAAVLHGLATALANQGRLEEAAKLYRASLDRDGKSALAFNNLGWMFAQLGRLDEAEANFRRAISLTPDYPEAHMCLATTLLRLGRFAEGWQEYEWRWKSGAKQFCRPPRPQPLWAGEPLNGRTLLVESEQGLGDILQFMRYVELLHQRGERLVFQCPQALKPLLETCSSLGGLLVSGEALPPFDVHVPLLSLPRVFGTTVDTVPANVPYLAVPPQRIADWGRRLADLDGFRIGIVWQGKPTYREDRQRSFHVRKFGPLAHLPGVHLISLQKGGGVEQLDEVPFPVRTLGDRFDEADGPFLDTAAVMMNLDLVIAPNTSVAHLAGALNVRVRVVLSSVAADWRWLDGRSDTPWYPSMRIYRQRMHGDWDEVFNHVYADVAALRRTAGSVAEVAHSPSNPSPPNVI
jgi:tetratricopeptide (TPR) repeat protein